MTFKSPHPFKEGQILEVISTKRNAKKYLGKQVTVQFCYRNRVIVKIDNNTSTDFAFAEVKKI